MFLTPNRCPAYTDSQDTYITKSNNMTKIMGEKNKNDTKKCEHIMFHMKAKQMVFYRY